MKRLNSAQNASTTFYFNSKKLRTEVNQNQLIWILPVSRIAEIKLQ